MNTSIPRYESPAGGYATPKVDAAQRTRTSSEPGRRFEAVDLSSTDWTPSSNFGTEARSLFIGTAGNVKVDGADYGTGVTFKVQDGQELHVAVTKVYKTGTTATDIVAIG